MQKNRPPPLDKILLGTQIVVMLNSPGVVTWHEHR